MRPRHVLPALPLLLCCLAGSASLAAVPPPTLPAGLAPLAAHPYDTNADARAVTDAALARGRQEHRTVLLAFGGNWCPDCRMLAGVFAEPAMHTWLTAHVVTASIDIGRFDRNLDIAERWGIKIAAVPTVLAIAPDGTLLNPSDPTALANDRSMTAQAVADQIAAWSR